MGSPHVDQHYSDDLMTRCAHRQSAGRGRRSNMMLTATIQ
jgi:biotin-(acetyl-CoA carboxylase) ligase